METAEAKRDVCTIPEIVNGKALEEVMQKAGIAPGLYLKVSGNERNEE